MTKLFVPAVHPGLVARPRLMKLLEEGTGRKLTVISAPAGFGKTTLVSAWHSQTSRSDLALVWLSLDARDNDTIRFLSYLAEAFHQVNPEISKATRSLLALATNIDPEVIITQLINGIGLAGEEIVFVLDDYHVIENQSIHDAVNFLVEHMPAGLHLVLTSRVDPPLALSRLRSQGEVMDIGADDLRFTVAETGEFLAAAIDSGVDEDDIAELESRTEGWAAGLQLAAISMRERGDAHEFIQSFSGQHYHIVDYLLDEVLHRQPDDIQEFLLQTSILERFNAGLCNAVTQRYDSQHMLLELERSNLFIVALDDERRWYRYHHLFADLLRQRLRQTNPAVSLQLHRRASVWFAENADPVEATWQAIYGEDWQRACDLIELNEHGLFNQGRSRTLLQLLQAIPDEVVLTRPWVLDTRVWANTLNGQADDAWRDMTALSAILKQAEHDPGNLSAVERQQLGGSVAAGRAFFSILQNDYAATLELTAEALRQLPEDDHERRSITRSVRALAFWLNGNLEDAAETLKTTIETGRLAESLLAQLVGMEGLAATEAEWGHLDRAGEIFQQAVNIVERNGLSNWQYAGRMLSFQSEIYYERNELRQALDLATRGREITATWANNLSYDITFYQLGQVHYALGDLEQAREVLSQAPPYANLGPGASDVARIETFLALIDLQSGNREQLKSIEHELLTPVSSLQDRIWRWTPVIRTRGQLLNALGIYDGAISILAPVFAICVDRGWVRQAIQTGAVLAVGQHRSGDHDTAIETFNQVLAYAEPHGFVRSLLDAGAGIEQVIESTINAHRVEHRTSAYLERLLKLAREERLVHTTHSASLQQGLVEPLSDRELEVLQLIAAGHTNAEIADQLFVVTGTVKAHANHIYGKLGVRNRTQAVNRARELNLID